MPADATRALQVLTHQLGRQPTLDELYRFMGGDPSGSPMSSNAQGPVQMADHPGPALLREVRGQDDAGPIGTLLRANELMEINPELAQAREELLRLLLFGPLGSKDLMGGGEQGHPNPNVPIVGPGIFNPRSL